MYYYDTDVLTICGDISLGIGSLALLAILGATKQAYVALRPGRRDQVKRHTFVDNREDNIAQACSYTFNRLIASLKPPTSTPQVDQSGETVGLCHPRKESPVDTSSVGAGPRLPK